MSDPREQASASNTPIIRPAWVGTARPYPGNLIKCPKCGHRRFDYMAEDYGACERRQCGFEWKP